MIPDKIRRSLGLNDLSFNIVDDFTTTYSDIDGQSTSDGNATWQKITGGTISSNSASGGYAQGSGTSNTIYAIEIPSDSYEIVFNQTTTASTHGGDCLYFGIVDSVNWLRVRFAQISSLILTGYRGTTHSNRASSRIHSFQVASIGGLI